ncbi:hypothetical protein J8273_5154 [Carpediemonas membranifera]|uniref:Uncharacterized protein n=1 Tax=Carpediemonas membranifera TaxID=201153 RepID=A0A8J6ARK0_9EUKA|nr:hypothetical protein J8273_5154 [Carpediemonas membranifera]|eukprot:KAG9392173.1 hypothetical protein J8273_5154 [Carpediemonas membranifera]
MMASGANPDLEDRVLEKAVGEDPYDCDIHDMIRQRLTPEAKSLWFLCRKFFFSLTVAEKDGESYTSPLTWAMQHHRMYAGRVFFVDTEEHCTFTRVQMPRALKLYNDSCFTHIALTPKGLWGWGHNANFQLGRPSTGGTVRLIFPAYPEVSELEASLAPWHKHELVYDVGMHCGRSVILTRAGPVIGGYCPDQFTGPVEDEEIFHPITLPDRFVPDQLVVRDDLILLSNGDRSAVSGENEHGELGLGHRNEMTGFQELPFRVDHVVDSGDFATTYCRDRHLLFVGLVSSTIARSGLLSGCEEGQYCLTPTPLKFREAVTGWFRSYTLVCWVTGGRTHCCGERLIDVPFEATALFLDTKFRNADGDWFVVSGIKAHTERVPVMMPCEPPDCAFCEIAMVDVDPWHGQ